MQEYTHSGKFLRQCCRGLFLCFCSCIHPYYSVHLQFYWPQPEITETVLPSHFHGINSKLHSSMMWRRNVVVVVVGAKVWLPFQIVVDLLFLRKRCTVYAFLGPASYIYTWHDTHVHNGLGWCEMLKQIHLLYIFRKLCERKWKRLKIV